MRVCLDSISLILNKSMNIFNQKFNPMRIRLQKVFSSSLLHVLSLLSVICISMTSVTFGQVSFTNTDTIFILDGTVVPIPGKPYPSLILVEEEKEVVAGARVTLHNVHHNFPDGIDLLLVAPDGTNVIVMSDVGGAPDLSGVNITLDDNASLYLPDRITFGSGTYKPTNMGNDIDLWPADAPTASGADELSAFNGINPNGTWSLYAVSDMDGTFGMIAGGWTLTLDVIKKSKHVYFKSFTATDAAKEDEIILDWETGIELKSGVFEIERAAQGYGWTKVGELSASAATDGVKYRYKDNTEEGKYKYRIKLILRDGSEHYSEIRSVVVRTTSFNVYPNPARNFTYIVSDSKVDEAVTVTLKDPYNNMLGSKQGTISRSSPMRFDLVTQKAGVHYLVITTATGQTVKTLNVIR